MHTLLCQQQRRPSSRSLRDSGSQRSEVCACLCSQKHTFQLGSPSSESTRAALSICRSRGDRITQQLGALAAQSCISLEDQRSHGHFITPHCLRFPSNCSHSWFRRLSLSLSLSLDWQDRGRVREGILKLCASPAAVFVVCLFRAPSFCSVYCTHFSPVCLVSLAMAPTRRMEKAPQPCPVAVRGLPSKRQHGPSPSLLAHRTPLQLFSARRVLFSCSQLFVLPCPPRGDAWRQLTSQLVALADHEESASGYPQHAGVCSFRTFGDATLAAVPTALLFAGSFAVTYRVKLVCLQVGSGSRPCVVDSTLLFFFMHAPGRPTKCDTKLGETSFEWMWFVG